MNDYITYFDTLNYSEYLAENLDSNTKYSEYLAENLDSNIKYAEYLSEQIFGYPNKETESEKAERIRILRKNKLERIINELDI